ncbi:glycosyl hydrolase 115 family protein [Galbibacter sp. PAP.153]|uniref:glycosyl hydrolase 115 family protein n=1 Tax=Galbibacter sp. PAP.153 TaxID=3104623 RepID=UPI00300BB920
MKINIKEILLIVFAFLVINNLQSQEKYVVNTSIDNGFALAENNNVAPILYSDMDYKGVQKVILDLQKDIESVSGATPKLYTDIDNLKDSPIIVGTLGKSPIINQLIEKKLIDESSLNGKWEKFIIKTIQNPFPGIKEALVIAGSDKRGTIYGIYDLCTQIGVSPWHFWADVPAKKASKIYITPGTHTMNEPKIKYRGVFINDEAPALSGWVYENYGSFNAEFYNKVFELILRLKGNYLWPAMWGRMFYVDDPKNKDLADEYGIVMGTSHHEPLTRAHAEWKKFGTGAWDYSTNAKNLEAFWRAGMERMGNTETIVTIGMRGDGDEPMTEGTAIELLENIVKKQRGIIADVTQKDITKTPQLWALYKEVQDYYDKGMRVPKDVTLLLCDDNWGNIRKLPVPSDTLRPGGYGVYYHFDYVGGPRNYKWINTNQIERTWEQMHLAYKHGVKNIWIVNVGDLKPMELPISFFLDFAWNPEKWNANNLPDYYVQWSRSIFGNMHAEEIADILMKYTKYNSRRKPELLSAKTYSIVNYGESDRIQKEFEALSNKAKHIYEKIPKAYKDAYYQLVLFPVLASANLNNLYIETAKNNYYAAQGRALTNETAKNVKNLFANDSILTNYYHTSLANGKWNHMMSQTHIGYTSWQEPRYNVMPKINHITIKDEAAMGIAIEGSNNWYPEIKEGLELPEFVSYGNETHFIEIFNSGKESFKYNIKPANNWLRFSQSKGTIKEQKRIWISLQQEKIPNGQHETHFTIQKGTEQVKVKVKINNPQQTDINGFMENDGYISMEAKNYSRSVGTEDINWITVPNLGKTSSGVTTLPVTIGIEKITESSPRLEFDFHSFSSGTVKIHAYFSPTLNYNPSIGHYYGIGIDEDAPKVINFHENDNEHNWNQLVANNIKIITTKLPLDKGDHTLKYYMKNSGLVLQKIVIETQPLKESYLGPDESVEIKK